MTMKRSTDRGLYRASARSARTGVLGDEGGLAFVEVDVELLAPMETVAVFDLREKRIHWRGGFSAAAIHRTLRSLVAMGATFPQDEPTALDGIGSRDFIVRVVEVDCSEEETHGIRGVKRFFVREVLPFGRLS